VEVVPDPSLAPKRWYKLRLRFRDDAKGPVTAICGFQGYLVSSMGQKVRPLSFISFKPGISQYGQIFVRAFDDDRLVGVAFLDVGVYVTSLRTLKNLLLIGDAVKSIMFVAFQVRTCASYPISATHGLLQTGGSIQAGSACEGY
jgi:cleavage and polyadenylation specificity factor subunit 1